MTQFAIGNRLIGDLHPVYFIAEIGANHEGSLDRAKKLIELAKKAGAECAKFQHYKADSLTSRAGFSTIGSLAHYSDNPNTVFRRFEVPSEWTPQLKEHCDKVGIEFMSTPYSLETVDELDPYVDAFKIGSGDITYTELIKKVVATKKPVILSTGASDIGDVLRAMQYTGLQVAVMQCNTNYSGLDEENYKHTNIRVLKDYKYLFPYAVLGLSDHLIHKEAVLAAVVFGAKIIEKHFSDDPARGGSPDHSFALSTAEFGAMVDSVRRMEQVMGSAVKKVEENERETVILQRRSLRARHTLHCGDILLPSDVVALRPAPPDSLPPYDLSRYVGKILTKDLAEGEHFTSEHFSKHANQVLLHVGAAADAED